ncbi:MAG: cytochrome C, partial [Paracoccaceae bacterium]|nr:cytochrome C [Paracoccaceae bacterium]
MTFPLLRALALAAAAWVALPVGAAAQEAVSLSKIVEGWAASGHADAEAEAFVHWNAEGEVPPQCAVCHAGAGFRDFHGLDGSAPGIEAPLPVGGVVDCDTCHAEGVAAITEIAFPSGISLPVLENAATCMTCHQGRSSGPTVAAASEGMEPDSVNPELSFLNPHYAAAAATNFGTEAKGLFEYPGQSYVGRFAHVPAASTCVGCHDPHSLEVKAEDCVACHATEVMADIRTTTTDFDGDGDT